MSITAENAIFDARVKKGATELDAVYGSDWRNKIDLSLLDMSSPTQCVLGQVYGSYSVGLAKLNVSSYNNDAQDYGFTTLESGDYGNVKINAAWLRFLSYKDGEVVEADGWSAAWPFIRIEKMVRVAGKTYYAIQPGDIIDGQFKPERYENPRLYTASKLGKDYKRCTPAPEKGSIVKNTAGEIYYIGKDNMAWLISGTTATWIAVSRIGAFTILKNVTGGNFNITNK